MHPRATESQGSCPDGAVNEPIRGCGRAGDVRGSKTLRRAM